MKISTRNLATAAIFATLYYVLSLITPQIPALGVADLKISLEALIATVFGIVLGPYLGFLTALLGSSVAWVLNTGMSPFAAPFLLSPPFNALASGLIFYRKGKWSFVLFAALIVAFPFLPPSQPITDYYYISAAVLWDKIIALFLIVPTVLLARKMMSNPARLSALFFLIAFIGNQVDNMWGADIFAVPIVYGGVYGFSLEGVRVAFVISPFIYPAIRLVQTIFATIILVPLMTAIKNTNWTYQEKTIIEQ